MKTFRMGWLVPAAIGSWAIAEMVADAADHAAHHYLPAGLLAGVMLVAQAALTIALATGRLEGLAVRVLGRARHLTAAESALVSGPLMVATVYGFSRDKVYLATDERTWGYPMGRDSLILTTGLLADLQSGRVGDEQAAAGLASSIARADAFGARFDLARRVWLAPGAAAVAVARWFGRMRVVGFLWRWRLVFAALAVFQSVHDTHQVHQDSKGYLLAGLMLLAVGLTYLCPWAWAKDQDAALASADAALVDAGWGTQLEQLVRTLDGPEIIERVHRIHERTLSVAAATVTPVA